MRFIFLLIVAAVAIIIAVVMFGLNKEKPAPAPVVAQTQQAAPLTESTLKTDDVLVAKTSIPLGTKITEAMVDTQPWPHHLVLEGFVLSSAGSTDVIGKIARAPLQAHEPFIKNKLANEKDPGFLAASLPPGMRALTVATDAVSGVAGFVFPGDRIDLLFIHAALEGGGANNGKPSLAEVLVPNLRVLAVNVRDTTPDGTSKVITPSSVTLEVSDENVQRIRLAEKQGTLSLSLRSIKDDNNDIPHPTRISDLSQVAAPAPKDGAKAAPAPAPIPDDGDEGVLIIRGGGSKGAITVNRSVNGVSAPAAKQATTNGIQMPSYPLPGAGDNNSNNIR